MSDMHAMSKQELNSYAATQLNVPRGTMLRATIESIITAVEAGDATLLRTKAGEQLVSASGVATTPAASNGLAELIATAIQPHLDIRSDSIMADVIRYVEQRMESFTPAVTTVRVELPSGEVKEMGRQHVSFAKLLRYLSAGLNVYIKGPAGSGKTTAVEKAAEALGLPFYCQSMGPMTSQSQLLGYMDANGRYVPGFLRPGFEHGGIILLDEGDNSNPGVLTTLNSAMANGYCSFPDGMVKRSERCFFVFAGNTYGTGADALYVGRQQLDAATLNRFVTVDWPYDERFERDLTLAINPDAGPWVDRVQAIRKAVTAARIRAVISPRQSMAGARLMLAGVSMADIEQDVVFAPLSTDDAAKVKAAL